MPLTKEVLEYVKAEYGTEPEYPWLSTPDTAVLRHHDNRKWYGAILGVRRDKLGLPGEEEIPVINLKCPPELAGMLRQEAGIFPGYHMNKEHWLSVLLDGSVPLTKICQLIDLSYEITRKKTRLKPAPSDQDHTTTGKRKDGR